MGKEKCTATNTIRIGLNDEDVRFVEQQKTAIIDTRAEIFRCLRIIVELNKEGEFISEDEKATLSDLVERWLGKYEAQFRPKKKTLAECRGSVIEKLARQVEKILSDYLPQAQIEVLNKLQDRLPVRER